MKKLTLQIALTVLLISPYSLYAEEELAAGSSTRHTVVEDEETHSIFHKLLWYLPNRVFDILDIVRLRVRVGPGVAVGIRATKLAQVYVGSYASIYAGLPGPRLRPFPKLPAGIETNSGATVSVVDATVGAGLGPDYSPTEFGFGGQVALIGLDFGIDPYEIVDFAAGLLALDLRDDDI